MGSRGKGKAGSGGVPHVLREEVDAIAEAVRDMLKPDFEQLSSLIEGCVKREEFSKVKCNVLKNYYENDSLKQYMKRENLRIGNFEPEGDLLTSVVNLFNHMASLVPVVDESQAGPSHVPQNLVVNPDAEPIVSKSDISACHWTNPRQGGKKQIIVRFVSRQAIRRIYSHKRKLRSSPIQMYRPVYICDDVTPLRVKLKSVVSDIPGVEKCFIKDGNVHCTYKKEHKVLSSPDDIFNQLKIVVTPEMLEKLNVTDYL